MSGSQWLPRVGALIVALAILLGTAMVSRGLVLCAPLGVWVTHRFLRARGKSLGLWTSWVGAVSATAVGFFLVAGIFANRLPAGSWSRMRQAADSASAERAKQPPPAWLNRIAPGVATGRAMSNSNASPFFNALGLLWGIGIFVGVVAGVVGTFGWFGTMLLVFYGSGDWLRTAPAIAIESDLA